MNRTFTDCGRIAPHPGVVSRRWYLALCGLALLCLGALQAKAQYVTKTIATSNTNITIDGQGVAVNSSGIVYATGSYPFVSATQRGGPVVQQILPSSAFVSGTGTFPGCGLSPNAAGFAGLGGLAVDGAGNLYVAQGGDGPVDRIAGGTLTCLTGANGYFFAFGVAPDGAGGAYFSIYQSSIVCHVTAAGAITLIAGTKTGVCGSNGTSTQLGAPYGLALDPSGNLFIADKAWNVVWKLVPSTGALTVVAGTLNTPGFSADGLPATQSLLNEPQGIALDPDGNLYIADTANDAIRMVRHSDQTMTTIAGNGMPGSYDDPNDARNSTFKAPHSIAVGPGGNVYVGEDVTGGNADVRELVVTGRAAMIFPTPGSVLTSPGTKFAWTSVPNVDQYRLTMGSSAGATDYFDDMGNNLIAAGDIVPNVPCEGGPLYVQLFTKLNGYWLPPQQYTYTAPNQCAHMINPPSGSILGLTQTFSWSAASGATLYELNVAYISPSGNTVTKSYSTTSTSFTVNNLPCDGMPVIVQLSTVLRGVPMPPANYAYTACKMLYLYASTPAVGPQGGPVDLALYVLSPPPGIASGQLTLTESIVSPPPLCYWNTVLHTWVCPIPVTLLSTPATTTYGQAYEFGTSVNIPAAPLFSFTTTVYGFTASFTVNGIVVDTATVTVTRY